MTTDLLMMDQAARFIFLKGGNLLESSDLGDRLRSRAGRLTADGEVSARVLRSDYIEGYRAAMGIPASEPGKVPTDQLIEETKQAYPNATGRQLREHFMAMGVINGIGAANRRLEEFAKLLILYSLEISYAEVLELIATGPLPL